MSTFEWVAAAVVTVLLSLVTIGLLLRRDHAAVRTA